MHEITKHRIRVTGAVLIGLGAVVLVGCDRTPKPGAAGAAASAAAAEPARGEQVVIEATAAEFFEARVLEVKGDRARVEAKGRGETRSVALGDLYRIVPGSALKAGSWSICKLGQQWQACRVKATSGAELEVETSDGKVSRIDRARALVPTPVTELNIKHQFARARDREEFDHALAKAGAPRAPKGWKPAPSEQVLGRTDDGWFSGRIHELGKHELHVRWQATGRISELGPANVVPLSSPAVVFKRGEFVLSRPVSPASPWVPMRIESATDTELVVRDVDNERHTLSTVDAVPFAP